MAAVCRLSALRFATAVYKQKRSEALYTEDSECKVRKSHENTQIQELYKNFLKEPNSELAHELLHTHYSKKERFQ